MLCRRGHAIGVQDVSFPCFSLSPTMGFRTDSALFCPVSEWSVLRLPWFVGLRHCYSLKYPQLQGNGPKARRILSRFPSYP